MNDATKIFSLTVLMMALTIPVFAKSVPVQIGDGDITYKNGRITKIKYNKDYYKVSYKKNKVILTLNYKPLEEPYKYVLTYKDGHIVREKDNLGYDTKITYKKGKITKSSCKNGTWTVKGDWITDKKGNITKVVFTARNNGKYQGKVTYNIKNKYKNGKLVSRKLKYKTTVNYTTSGSYSQKFVWKNKKMTKGQQKKAKAIAMHMANPLYTWWE